MLYVEILLIAISLSMDAFSLSISLSTLNIKNKNKYVFFVGLFHFFMPILGLYLKLIFDKVYKVPSNALFIAVIVFIIIGIIIDNDKKITSIILNPIFFSFSVSIDSFTVGATLNRSIIILSSTIFMLVSSFFTFLGIKIGRIIKKNLNKYTKYIAILILVVALVFKLTIL